MDKLHIKDRYGMIYDLAVLIKDRTESIYDELCDKDFDITDEENQEYMRMINYHIETLQRYL